MRRAVGSVALALTLLGCHGGPASAPGASAEVLDAPSLSAALGPVPLLTVDTQTSFGSCVADLYYVADLIADPKSGAPTDAATGKSFAWPRGFTTRRAGTEVEVLDAAEKVVLLTGQRYRLCPAPDNTKVGLGLAARSLGGGWVIGMVDDCTGCKLGGYGYPFDSPDCNTNPTDAGCKPHERPGGPTPTPPQFDN